MTSPGSASSDLDADREWAMAVVTDAVGFVLELDAADIPLDADLYDDLAADSLQLVEIAARLEEHLAAPVEAEDWRTLSTVRDAVDLLARSRR